MASTDEATVASQVLRLARQVTARHDLQDVLAETFRSLRAVLPFGGGSIQLLDDEGYISMAACEPVVPPHVQAQRIPLGNSVAGRVILTERPVYLSDLQAADLPSSAGTVLAAGVRAYLGVPLLVDGRAIGLLQIDSEQPDAWTEEQRDVLMTVAPIVAAAIQNARAHARATAARLRAAAVEQRIGDIARIVATIRTCVEAHDTELLARQLGRLEKLVGEPPSDDEWRVLPAGRPHLTALPSQRLAVG
jgi:phosphoserine phosphatase RsbU/P